MPFNYFFITISLLINLITLNKSTPKSNNKPNILFILVDDQAYADLSITGNKVANTPTIDLLAKEGILCKNFYVSPVCAPTRASLLTGRYHQRTGVSGVTRGRENMNLDEETLANILNSLGYKTGIFGKWHNGAHYPYHPLGRGFDTFVGFTAGHWSSYFNTTIEKNKSTFKTVGYLPDVLTDEAIKFISDAHEENQPFFCYLPYPTPHTPLQVPDEYFNKYKQKGINDFNATIYGMNENIDHNMDKIINHLENLDIRNNTIIVYLSDNGPVNYRYNAGLKGKKGSVNEGGVRVPMIINWKDQLPSGITLNQSLAHIDVLPTLIELIDETYPYKKKLDGISFKPLLNHTASISKRLLFSEWNGQKRVLFDKILMVDNELYNLDLDPKQTNDIRLKLPMLFDSLNTAYNQWFKQLTPPQKTASIPIGHHGFNTTNLVAHEAQLYPPFEFRKDRKHTGIAYHSLYGWANDWIDFWTNTLAYPSWNVEIVTAGSYDFYLEYALDYKDQNTILELNIGDHTEIIKGLKPFIHDSIINHDRVLRQVEAPETSWRKTKIANFSLEKGHYNLNLKALEISGSKSIELKSIIVKKVMK